MAPLGVPWRRFTLFCLAGSLVFRDLGAAQDADLSGDLSDLGVEEVLRRLEQQRLNRDKGSNCNYLYVLAETESSSYGYAYGSSSSSSSKVRLKANLGEEVYEVSNQFKDVKNASDREKLAEKQKLLDKAPIVKDNKPVDFAQFTKSALSNMSKATWNLYYRAGSKGAAVAPQKNQMAQLLQQVGGGASNPLMGMLGLGGGADGGTKPAGGQDAGDFYKNMMMQQMLGKMGGGGALGGIMPMMMQQMEANRVKEKIEQAFRDVAPDEQGDAGSETDEGGREALEPTAAYNAAVLKQNKAFQELGISRVGVIFSKSRVTIKDESSEPPSVLPDILDPEAVLICARVIHRKAGRIVYFQKPANEGYYGGYGQRERSSNEGWILDADGHRIMKDPRYGKRIGYRATRDDRRIFEYYRIPASLAKAAAEAVGESPAALFSPFIENRGSPPSIKADVIWATTEPRAWFAVNYLHAPKEETKNDYYGGGKRMNYDNVQKSSLVDMYLYPRGDPQALELAGKGFQEVSLSRRPVELPPVRIEAWMARFELMGPGMISVEVALPAVDGYRPEEFALYAKRSNNDVWRAYTAEKCVVQLHKNSFEQQQKMQARVAQEQKVLEEEREAKAREQRFTKYRRIAAH